MPLVLTSITVAASSSSNYPRCLKRSKPAQIPSWRSLNIIGVPVLIQTVFLR